MKLLAAVISILVISLILYSFYFLHKNNDTFKTYDTVEDCIFHNTKSVASEKAAEIAIRMCRIEFSQRASRELYQTILAIEEAGYQANTVINLAQYRAENSSYYGQQSLADVAKDVYVRSGSAASGVSFEDFIKLNGMIEELATEARAKGIANKR